MVLQRASSHSRSRVPHPDATRVAGMAGAIALNLAVFGVLLIPLSRPELLRIVEDRDPDLTWIVPKQTPPPPPPERVEIVRPRTPLPQPQPQPRPVAADTAPAPQPAIVDQGSLAADPVTETTAPAIASLEPAPPAEGVRLEYREAPPPPYPPQALRAGLQGVVLLQVRVAADGRPLAVEIHRSSGHRELDAAARRHVLRQWTFRPAMKDGRAVEAIGLVPIAFGLERG